MKTLFTRLMKLAALTAVCSMLTACEDPQVYGSVGVSSWSGGSSRMHGSVSIGGRIR